MWQTTVFTTTSTPISALLASVDILSSLARIHASYSCPTATFLEIAATVSSAIAGMCNYKVNAG